MNILHYGNRNSRLSSSDVPAAEMGSSCQGKVALVTGAASGTGLATATAFAQAGDAVALVDVGEDTVRLSEREFVTAGHTAIAKPDGGTNIASCWP